MPTTKPAALKAPLARYANYFEVGHNRYEFLLDFGQFHPETEQVVLHTRIALGPPHAKLLWQLITSAIRACEAKSGEIASLDQTDDGLSAMLRTLPDFERRALDARRRARTIRGADSNRSSALKR
jgi:hypothetical protein